MAGRVGALLLRYVYLYRRSLPRAMELFFWPVMDLLVWGFLSGPTCSTSPRPAPSPTCWGR